jgi:hypothetical protein
LVDLDVFACGQSDLGWQLFIGKSIQTGYFKASWQRIKINQQLTTIYKNNAITCLESKLPARLQRLIFLRKIILASSHSFYTGRCKKAKKKQMWCRLKEFICKTQSQRNRCTDLKSF